MYIDVLVSVFQCMVLRDKPVHYCLLSFNHISALLYVVSLLFKLKSTCVTWIIAGILVGKLRARGVQGRLAVPHSIAKATISQVTFDIHHDVF